MDMVERRIQVGPRLEGLFDFGASYFAFFLSDLELHSVTFVCFIVVESSSLRRMLEKMFGCQIVVRLVD